MTDNTQNTPAVRDRLARERTALANDRTALANERTFLAYMRTAIMILASGVTVLKLFPDERPMLFMGYILIPFSFIIALTTLLYPDEPFSIFQLEAT